MRIQKRWEPIRFELPRRCNSYPRDDMLVDFDGVPAEFKVDNRSVAGQEDAVLCPADLDLARLHEANPIDPKEIRDKVILPV